VDGFIVRQNVARSAAGSELDVAYLASLSPDSVPALVTAYRDQTITGNVRDAVGAALVCREYVYSNSRDKDWRSFTLSGWQADQSLGLVQSSLDSYQAQQVDWDTKVLTPGGSTYDCYQTGMGG
jgi:hypothetical protein